MENETAEKPNENECTGCKCLNNPEYKPKPAVYVEKTINMVLEINNAIDLPILERYKEILGQFTRDSKKMCNINLNPNYCTLDEFDQEKNRVLRLVLTMLRTIEQATNDMMVLLCNEQIGYFSIDVIGFLYDAMKSKLCYANLTIRWNEFISQTKEHLAYIDANYKDKEELRKVKEELFAEGEHSFYKIFESWLWEFRDLKLQCAKILKLYLKIKEHRDYDDYIFDANMVEKCKIDQLYLYIKDHVDYVSSFYTQMHPFTERLFFVSGIDYLHECLDTMYNSSYFSAGLLDKKIKKYLQLVDKNDSNGIHCAKLLIWNKELQSRHHLVRECIRRFSGVCKVMRKDHLGENTDEIVFIEEENMLQIQKRHDNIHKMTQSNFTDVPVKELKLHKVKTNTLIGIVSILTLVNCALLYKILIK